MNRERIGQFFGPLDGTDRQTSALHFRHADRPEHETPDPSGPAPGSGLCSEETEGHLNLLAFPYSILDSCHPDSPIGFKMVGDIPFTPTPYYLSVVDLDDFDAGYCREPTSRTYAQIRLSIGAFSRPADRDF